MATTKIKAVYSSAGSCLDYVMNDKSHGNAVEGSEFEFDDSIGNLIAYATNDKTGEVTFKTLTTHHNCIPGAEMDSFSNDMYNGMGVHYMGNRTKNGQIVAAYHLIQSFEGHETDPGTANEIGLKLARELFGNHAVTVSTHTNTENVHNHIVICAWDRDGYKYHDCYDTYRKIRKVSDRLCEEHGLSVLENTRDMTMKRYVGKDGKTHHVEVTQRKIENWKHYDKGIAPISKANDYRHSDAYESICAEKQYNRESIKEDMDLLLPHVSSYDELLSRMRDMGYEINDRKVNGDWLKHIAFKAPGQQKGTRDYKIGDGVFYTRANLTLHIEELAAARARNNRVETASKGAGSALPKTGVSTHLPWVSYEHIIRAGIKESEAELAVLGYQPVARPHDYVERLRQQIQDGFMALAVIEEKKLTGMEMMNGLYKAEFNSFNRLLGEISGVREEISRLEGALSVRERTENLAERLSSRKPGSSGIISDDALQLYFKEQYEKTGIDLSAGSDKIRKDIEAAKGRMTVLISQAEKCSRELVGYEACAKVFNRIDRKNGTRDDKAMKDFYTARAKGRKIASSYAETPSRERSRGYER